MSNSDDYLSQLIAAEDRISTESVCTEAIADNAHNANSFINRGIARTHLHRHNEALEDFDLAISIDPINQTAILGRARVLLIIGLVDKAESVVTSVLEEDIGDKNAHKLLKEVALVKFRAIIPEGFACGPRTQLSYFQMFSRLLNKQITTEEMRSVRLEFMKMWCDCVENLGNSLLFFLTKNFLYIIAVLCSSLQDYKLSMFCLYLSYGAILEDSQSATIEQTIILRNISSSLIKLGNFESARKIITMAINLKADSEAKLMNQLILSDLQLQEGAIDEPLQKLAQIRKEGEERGFSRIVIYSDMLTFRAKMSINQVTSGTEVFENIHSLPGLGALEFDETRTDMDHLINSGTTDLLQFMKPNESEGTIEQSFQMASRLANNPLPLYPGTSNFAEGSKTNALIGAIQSLNEALNSFNTHTAGVVNVNALEKAQNLFDKVTDGDRKAHTTRLDVMWESTSAFIDLLCGRREQANEKYKRCLNFARNQNRQLFPKICLSYAFALLVQMKLDEALTMSLEAENSYLEIYHKTTSEDQKITINQEGCMVGSLLISIFILKKDAEKALYECERYRMPSLRKTIQLPFNEEGPMNNRFIFQLRNYCKINSSIIVYLSNIGYGLTMHCWFIFQNRMDFRSFPLREGLNSMPEQNVNIIKMMELPGNSFRKFPISSNSNSNSERSEQFVNLVSRNLWRLLSNYVLDNISKPKRIVIIPDRKLHLIPYAILGNNSASKSISDYPLLNTFIISQSPSFWALSNTWMKKTDTSQNESFERERRPLALVIGNPQSNLPAAEEEALLVTQNLEKNTELEVIKLTQELATRDIVLDSLRYSRIVHIASHGTLDADEQHIRAGAIHLADGTLYAKEIEVFHKIISKFIRNNKLIQLNMKAIK